MRAPPVNAARRAAPLLFTAVVLAAAFAGGDVDEVLGKLRKRYDGITDASCSFTKTFRFGVTSSEQKFKGRLTMKKGNRYRIELEDQTIVTDGASVWSYSAETNQVLIDTYRDDPRSFSPDKILVDVSTRYAPGLLEDEKRGDRTLRVVKLIPRDEASRVQWIKVWVDEDAALMEKFQVLDVSDNLTTYDLEDIRINPGVPDSRFRFVPPDSADVVDLRR